MNDITDERLLEINKKTLDRSNMFYWQTDKPLTMQETSILFGDRYKTISDDQLIEILNRALYQNEQLKEIKAVSISGSESLDIGSVNLNRKFKLSNNINVIGRFHPKFLQNGYFNVEVTAANLVLNNKIRCAKPVIVQYSNSNSVQDNLDFILFEMIPGDNMKFHIAKNPDDEKMLVNAAGSLMANIHSINVDGYGFFDNKIAGERNVLIGIHDSYRDHCLAGLDSNLKTIVEGQYIDQKQANNISQLLESSDLIDCEQPVLIHNDLADWNIMLDDKNNCYAIDWDECHGGDPIADIACWSLFFPQNRLSMLIDGYKDVRELPYGYLDKLHIYKLRYVVSKNDFAPQKISYDQSDLMKGLIRSGLEALDAECSYFKL